MFLAAIFGYFMNGPMLEPLKQPEIEHLKKFKCSGQVVGVFPGPRFDDPEGLDGGEADFELLGWEDCAENLSFRIDKAWRQRCSQRCDRGP